VVVERKKQGFLKRTRAGVIDIILEVVAGDFCVFLCFLCLICFALEFVWFPLYLIDLREGRRSEIDTC
jgi:hypothetical protein